MVQRVQMKTVNYDGGQIYYPDAVVDMEDNKANYLKNFNAAVVASAAGLSTAPTPPTRVDNRPSASNSIRGFSAASALMGAETRGLTFDASDQSMFIKDNTGVVAGYIGDLASKLGSIRTSPARYYGSDGFLKWGPENLFLRSQEFDNAAWSKDAGATVSANQTVAPDGTLTADTFTDDGIDASNRRIYAAINNLDPLILFTFSIYAKAGSGRYLMVSCGGLRISGATGSGADRVCIFDLQAGVITNTSFYTTLMTPVGNGWYRCSVTVQADADAGLDSASPYVRQTTSPTSIQKPTFSQTVYLWGAQFERASVPSAYKATVAAVYYGLRLDYDSRLNGKPGYLIEEARVNLALRSQELDNAAWAQLGATVTPNAETAPDGTATMDSIVSTVANNTAGLSQTFTGTAVPYTVSCFVKKISGSNWFRLGMTLNATPQSAWFNLATGAVGSMGAGLTATITPVSGLPGVYRVSITGTCAAVVETVYLRLASNDNNASAGNIGDTIAVWGVQIEAGSFASSYIATTAASVTRTEDVPMLLAGVPTNDAEGTLIAKGVYLGVGAQAGYMMEVGSIVNERHLIARNTNRTMTASITDGGVNQANFVSSGNVADFAVTSAAFRYKLNDSAVVMAGEAVQTDTVCTMPVVSQMGIGNSSLQSRPMNGWLQQGQYFTRGLSNAELAAKAA